MKKIFSVIATLCVISFSVSAYPTIGGNEMFELESPFDLTKGASTVGGAIFSATPSSLIVNPALTARENRVGMEVAYTALFGTGPYASFGSVFETGIMIPFDWAVLSGMFNATLPCLGLGISNSCNWKFGLAKEITNHLFVGAGLNVGFSFGYCSDWLLSGSIGFVYDIPEVGFIRDLRFGASALNLGKNYAPYSGANFFESYPGFGTFKAGIAAVLVSNDVIKLGVSSDVTTPFFTDLILDFGAQFVIKDMFVISVAEKIDFAELAVGATNLIPSVGVFFTFTFKVNNNSYLDSHGWAENEMTVGGAYKNLYGNIHAISVGADLLLGTKDETAPEIKLWDDED